MAAYPDRPPSTPLTAETLALQGSLLSALPGHIHRQSKLLGRFTCYRREGSEGGWMRFAIRSRSPLGAIMLRVAMTDEELAALEPGLPFLDGLLR
jgi:hypothetical protein